MELIYIQLGKNFPSYLNDSIETSYSMNPDLKIYVAVNSNNLDKLENVISIDIDQIEKSDKYIYFLKNNKMRKSRNGFWIYTIERFFVLYEIMKKYNLKNIFHIESDNLIYCDLSEIKNKLNVLR